jgi:alpha-L-fucosidase
MTLSEQEARIRRVMQWFGPARFGLFHHWGLFTGGGNTYAGPRNRPLAYSTIREFEAAAPEPAVFAKNIIATALRARARYITFTVVHSCDGWAVMYPTKVPGFLNIATRDYIGALVEEGARSGVKIILYVPGSMGHWDSVGGPWVGECLRSPEGYGAGLRALVQELVARHGTKIAGFWLDGLMWQFGDLPALIHRLLPDAVVAVNGHTRFNARDMDVSTTEFLSNRTEPPYNRPGGLIKPIEWVGCLPPRKDFNEDIPTCNDWWHGALPYTDGHAAECAYLQGLENYQRDPLFWIREMLCSLGLRGQWNYTMGLGPMLDGTVPEEFKPMIGAMESFMSWAAESIFETTGGEGSGLLAGWCNDGAFCTVTVSLKDPTVHYIHVTGAPKNDCLRVQTNFRSVQSVENLRTGEAISFTQNGAVEITPKSWTEVAEHGAAVFRVILEPLVSRERQAR